MDAFLTFVCAAIAGSIIIYDIAAVMKDSKKDK